MAYDEALAERVRDLLADRDDLREQPMFGGLSFMVRGNLACGVRDDDLVVRPLARGRRGSTGGAARAPDGLHRPADARLALRRPGSGAGRCKPRGLGPRSLAHCLTLKPK